MQFRHASGHRPGFNDLKVIEVAELPNAHAMGKPCIPDFREAHEVQRVVESIAISSRARDRLPVERSQDRPRQARAAPIPDATRDAGPHCRWRCRCCRLLNETAGFRMVSRVLAVMELFFHPDSDSPETMLSAG